MADGVTLYDGLDIEARQDEVLRQLDELNQRVELALVALIGQRAASEGIARMMPATVRKNARAA
jgi:hypothetical protein